MAAKKTAPPPAKTSVSPVAAPVPVKVSPPAPAATPQAPARLARKPAPAKPEPAVVSAPAPAPAEVKTPAPPAAPKKSARQVADKPKTPKPVADFEKATATLTVALTPEPLPAAAAPLTERCYLTLGELVGTAIEVRNGTWTRHLARQTRTRLCREGFTVSEIGNHIDFGATRTIIYYRPGAERVARSISLTFFPEATLTQTENLKQSADVKILLGADLQKQPAVMASLVSEVR